MMVLWGHVSPQLLQKTMSLAVEDMHNHAAGILDIAHVEKLAGLGSDGRHENNIWRDLKNMLPAPKLPKLHYMFLPMQHTVLGRFWRSVPMLLPHELFSAIFHHYPVMWDKLILGSSGTCKKIWNAVRGSQHFRYRPHPPCVRVCL